MKKSLIYIKGGSVIRIDDTLLNRIKAKLRGFKLIREDDWGVDWVRGVNKCSKLN